MAGPDTAAVPRTRAEWRAWVHAVNPGEVRRRAGVRQDRLAARIGASRNALGYWENGSRTPTDRGVRAEWYQAVQEMADSVRAPVAGLPAVPSTQAEWRTWVCIVNPGEVRRRAGTAQGELAARLGVSPNSLGLWERGCRMPGSGETGGAWVEAVTTMAHSPGTPPATPAELRLAVAGLIPGADADLVEAIAVVAEEHAAVLLGGRHPSCGRWMPKAMAPCGLAAGHLEPCVSVAAAKRRRADDKRRALKAEGLKAAA